MPKVILNKEECIGCGACAAVLEDFFEIGDDRKSTIRGGKTDGDIVTLDVSDKDLEKLKEALDVCPVGALKVEK